MTCIRRLKFVFHSNTKKPRVAGLWNSESHLRVGGRVQRRSGAGSCAFLQDLLSVARARSTASRDTQALAELIQVVHTSRRSAADLLVGD